MTSPHPLAKALTALAISASATLAIAQEPAPAASAPPASTRFEAFNDGTVRDNQTGLFWAAKDNGGNVDWAGAMDYCKSLGAGWDLPRIEELHAIHLPDGAEGQACIGQLTCKMTPLIAVSGLTPWSQDANGPSEAWYLYLADGERYAYDVSDSHGRRALCVRR
jgi:hypothetical protein